MQIIVKNGRKEFLNYELAYNKGQVWTAESGAYNGIGGSMSCYPIGEREKNEKVLKLFTEFCDAAGKIYGA